MYKINKIKEIYGVPLTSSPATADTIYTHFYETDRTPDYYDYVITGDLASVGSDILLELLGKKGMELPNHIDCGSIIFDREAQKVASGGSGCGCIASVFSGYWAKKLISGEIKRILLIATGALMSPSSVLIGEPITGVAHAVSIERND